MTPTERTKQIGRTGILHGDTLLYHVTVVDAARVYGTERLKVSTVENVSAVWVNAERVRFD